MRRGLKMEALKEFMLGQGASKNMTYQVGNRCEAERCIVEGMEPCRI